MLNFLKKRKEVVPQVSLDGIDLHLSEIPGAILIADGFPRVEWQKVREAATQYLEHPGIDQIWTELAAQWLGILRTHLGGNYEIYEGKRILLLSARSMRESKALLEIADGAFERLEKMLYQKPRTHQCGKSVVLLPEKTSVYYDYISYFYSESDRTYGASSGMHTSQGYGHIVINGNSKSVLQTLVHELAHAMVAERPLPRWLNEGLAQFVEDMVPGYRAPLIDARQARLHRRYWSWFKMDHFWNGQGFKGASSQRVSYQLAEILFRNLVTDRSRRGQLAQFLATAHRDDAGASACRQSFGCPLSKLIEEFLGPGSWEMKPKDIAAET